MNCNYTKIKGIAGIGCYSDAFIVDTDFRRLYLVSLFERPNIVKAISSLVIQGTSIKIGAVQVSRPDIPVRVFTHTESGLSHKLLYCPDFFHETSTAGRILIKGDKDTAFRFLDNAVSTPLKREWLDFLIEREALKIKDLFGFGSLGDVDLSKAVFASLGDENIEDLVLNGIKSGEIN